MILEFALVPTVSSTLAHMNFRLTAFKAHIVHICLHQPDTVSMFASSVRLDAVVVDISEVKSFTLICNDN